MSDTPQRQDNTAHKADHAKNSGKAAARAAVTQDKEHSYHGEHHPYCKGEPAKWWHRIDWSQVVLDTLLLAVGIVLACIYSGQLSQMIQANKLGRQSLEDVQRAFVNYADQKQTRIRQQTGHRWQFDLLFDNSGVTPAVATIAHVQIKERYTPPEGDDFIGDEKTFEVGNIGPKAVTTWSPITAPTEEYVLGTDFADIQKMTFADLNGINDKLHMRPIYLWAWVGYRDIFQKPHVVEACFRLQYLSISLPKNDLVWMWGNCAKHNCTDEYCPQYQEIENKIPLPGK